MRVWARGTPAGLAELHDAGLQPVDADRLLVAALVLEADVDIVAALEHLLGGLGETRLVAIERRDGEEAGQKRDEAERDQPRRGAAMRGRREIGDRAEARPARQSFGRLVDHDGHASFPAKGRPDHRDF